MDKNRQKSFLALRQTTKEFIESRKVKKNKYDLENIFPPRNKNKRLQRIVSPNGKEKYLFGLNIYQKYSFVSLSKGELCF
jgi:hypothetical protein